MIAKPRPRMLEKRAAKLAIASVDRFENQKVKERSGGQCEVRVEFEHTHSILARNVVRCALRASHVHHLISGIGRRNVGKSIEAAHKLHICERCHSEIHGHVLNPVNAYERDAAATVRYERRT